MPSCYDGVSKPNWYSVNKMDIKRSGSQPSAKGPNEYFTGTVRIDPLSEAHNPSVTFEPGVAMVRLPISRK